MSFASCEIRFFNLLWQASLYRFALLSFIFRWTSTRRFSWHNAMMWPSALRPQRWLHTSSSCKIRTTPERWLPAWRCGPPWACKVLFVSKCVWRDLRTWETFLCLGSVVFCLSFLKFSGLYWLKATPRRWMWRLKSFPGLWKILRRKRWSCN